MGINLKIHFPLSFANKSITVVGEQERKTPVRKITVMCNEEYTYILLLKCFCESDKLTRIKVKIK